MQRWQWQQWTTTTMMDNNDEIQKPMNMMTPVGSSLPPPTSAPTHIHCPPPPQQEQCGNATSPNAGVPATSTWPKWRCHVAVSNVATKWWMMMMLLFIVVVYVLMMVSTPSSLHPKPPCLPQPWNQPQQHDMMMTTPNNGHTMTPPLPPPPQHDTATNDDAHLHNTNEPNNNKHHTNEHDDDWPYMTTQVTRMQPHPNAEIISVAMLPMAMWQRDDEQWISCCSLSSSIWWASSLSSAFPFLTWQMTYAGPSEQGAPSFILFD